MLFFPRSLSLLVSVYFELLVCLLLRIFISIHFSKQHSVAGLYLFSLKREASLLQTWRKFLSIRLPKHVFHRNTALLSHTTFPAKTQSLENLIQSCRRNRSLGYPTGLKRVVHSGKAGFIFYSVRSAREIGFGTVPL